MAADIVGIIEVRFSTDLWGPFIFNFPSNSAADVTDGCLPYNDAISSADVSAYVGSVQASSDLVDFVEITTNLIDPSYIPIIAANSVKLKLQYPGDTYKGTKVTLIFELTLTSGAKHPFYFQYVKVK